MPRDDHKHIPGFLSTLRPLPPSPPLHRDILSASLPAGENKIKLYSLPQNKSKKEVQIQDLQKANLETVKQSGIGKAISQKL